MSIQRRKSRVLFLCAGNSCRSQMAEAWARSLLPGAVEAHSAGAVPKGIDPRAVQVMKECGIDLEGHRSKGIEEVLPIGFDAVITLCDDARESCPVFPGEATFLHARFEDPPRLAAGARTEEEALAHYRRVRDEIRAFVERLPGELSRRGV